MAEKMIIPTGLVMKDYLKTYNIRQKDACRIMKVSQKHLSNLLNGKVGLTTEMAIKFEKVLPDIPASYWINHEGKYRLQEAKNDHSI